MIIDLDRSSPLFESVLPVRLCSSDTDEGERMLTVRLLSGSRTNSTSVVEKPRDILSSSSSASPKQGVERVLHFEVSDELDPFFLYSLDVGESDFHELRREHALLVDFCNFPGHYVALLQKCGAPRADVSYFVALDKIKGKMSIVESNKFKQVTHVALRVEKGCDSAVKSFLAGRLELAHRQRDCFEGDLKKSRQQLEVAQAKIVELSEKLASSDEARALADAGAKGVLLAELSKVREEHAAVLETMRNDHAIILEAERQSRIDSVKESREETWALEQRLEETRAAKDEAVSMLAEAKQQLETLENREQSALAELAAEKSARKAAEGDRDRAEASDHAAQVKLAAATQRADDAEREVVRADALRSAADESRRSRQEDFERLSKTNKRRDEQLKAAAQEIRRGNGIIEKLSDQARSLNAKVKLKSDLVRQLERRVDDARRELEDRKREIEATKADAKRLEEQSLESRQQLDDALGKLKDATELIENNQQVIQYLNSELNEHQQLGRTSFKQPYAAAAVVSPITQHQEERQHPPQNVVEDSSKNKFHVSVQQDQLNSTKAEAGSLSGGEDPAVAYFERYNNVREEDSTLFGGGASSTEDEDTLGLISTATPPTGSNTDFHLTAAEGRPSSSSPFFVSTPKALTAGYY